VKCPIVPIGIAGAFDAWPRQRRLPKFAPLFMPPRKGSIAVCVGRALDGQRYADMPREQILDELLTKIHEVEDRAERLRRK
jgi:1-acyl-sn-glycerol-3-phosphate acyltransferase